MLSTCQLSTQKSQWFPNLCKILFSLAFKFFKDQTPLYLPKRVPYYHQNISRSFPVHSLLLLEFKSLFILQQSASPTTCMSLHMYTHPCTLSCPYTVPLFLHPYEIYILFRPRGSLAPCLESCQTMLISLLLNIHRPH